MVDDVFASYYAGGAQLLSSCKCTDNYERGGVIDRSMALSMDFILIVGPVCNKMGKMHQRRNALIYG